MLFVVERWWMGVNVVGAPSSGRSDVELFRVGVFGEQEVCFVDGGALRSVDRGGEIDAHVTGGDVLGGERGAVAGVAVLEVELVVGAGEHGPAVAVCAPTARRGARA